MARGDRRGSIVCDDEDRQRFVSTLGEACERTGFIVHAYALLPNHYHIALEIPEANLVDGMRWLQNTYTRRFNVRHKLWGHVFGGCYCAADRSTQPRLPPRRLVFRPPAYHIPAALHKGCSAGRLRLMDG